MAISTDVIGAPSPMPPQIKEYIPNKINVSKTLLYVVPISQSKSLFIVSKASTV